MPKPCRHPEPVASCRVCWLAANDRRYQARWGLPVTAPERRPSDWVTRPNAIRPGLGDDIKALTVWLGLAPAGGCGGCDRRRRWLNRWPGVRGLWRRIWRR